MSELKRLKSLQLDWFPGISNASGSLRHIKRAVFASDTPQITLWPKENGAAPFLKAEVDF
jgi:hypothetical protein